MKYLISIVFSFLLLLFAGDNKRIVLKQQYDMFTVDNVGNVYAVKGDEIKKYNKKGELLKVFSNKKSGKIFSIDASNPLRVLVFYKDQSQVIILDSQLTQNGDAIDLQGLNLEQSELICSSFNNGIWLYSRQNAELIRLDQQLNKAVSTGNLINLLNAEIKPNYLIENNGLVYLNDTQNGIYVFDIYGTYYKTISITGLQSFQVADQQVYYYKDSVLTSYHSRFLTQYDTVMPKPYPNQIKWMTGTYYKFYSDSLVWE